MRKIIYVLVVVSIAIVNTVFTIRNSDEIVDLVSLKSEAFANNDEISGGALGPLHKFGCGIPEKVIVAYDSDNNPIFAEIIREGELGECGMGCGKIPHWGSAPYQLRNKSVLSP